MNFKEMVFSPARSSRALVNRGFFRLRFCPQIDKVRLQREFQGNRPQPLRHQEATIALRAESESVDWRDSLQREFQGNCSELPQGPRGANRAARDLSETLAVSAKSQYSVIFNEVAPRTPAGPLSRIDPQSRSLGCDCSVNFDEIAWPSTQGRRSGESEKFATDVQL